MARPSRPPYWYARLARRVLLVATAIGVVILAACSPALADEVAAPSTLANMADTTALARVAIVDGRLDDALRVLARVIATERSEDERAAAAEVRAVVDRWVALGGEIAARASRPVPAPSASGDEGSADTVPTPDAWESAFSVSRARLVAGRFEDAAPGFSLLLGSARTAHQSLRAYALGALSSELAHKGMVLRIAQRPGQGTLTRGAPDWHRHRRDTRWYGWQTLISDGTSLLLVPLLGTRIASGETVAYVAVGGYLLGAPVVHLAHGRPGMAAASLGLRVVMPLAGALVGAGLERCRGDLCGLGGALVGGALGVISATVIDAAALTHETVADEDEPRDARTTSTGRSATHAPAPKSVAVTPAIGPRSGGGFDVGVGGTF